jgi:rod shape-determining protein MreC
MIQRLISEDLLLPLHFENIPNYQYIDENYKNLYYDPDNAYSVPYMFGMVGVIYNSGIVAEEDIGSWDLMWNEKYTGKILQFNNPRDAFGTAMYWQGIDVNTEDTAQWEIALAKLQEQAANAAAVQRENDRLRDLVELQKEHPDYKLVDGYIIGRSSVDWTSTLTVNVGKRSGVDVGMVAITANGEVVGLVTEAGTNYAVIKTVLDSSLEISASSATSGYSGMVQGAYTSDLSGKLRMDYISSLAVIRNNDQVVTAGSTVYPRGLLLGRIIDAGFNDTGVAKFAILEPAADIEGLEQVFILTEFDGE